MFAESISNANYFRTLGPICNFSSVSLVNCQLYTVCATNPCPRVFAKVQQIIG